MDKLTTQNAPAHRRLSSRDAAVALGMSFNDFFMLTCRGTKRFDPLAPKKVNGTFDLHELMKWKKVRDDLANPQQPTPSIIYQRDRRSGRDRRQQP